MKFFFLVCTLLISLLVVSAEEQGQVLYFRKALFIPGFPRPTGEQLPPAEVEAIKKGEERRYAYIEAYYSSAGLLEKLQKIFKGKVLWKYEFMYANGDVIRIMEYDSKGKVSVYYDFRDYKAK